MLNLTLPTKANSSAIPGHVTTLSVSWLNNQFKAQAIHRGEVDGVWECPVPVDTPARFESALVEAVEQTEYRGHTVSLLMAHPRLVQQLVDVPPVKGPALRKILQRQAHQQKMFSGDAAWACQGSPPTKGPQRVVLHLFPRTLLTQLLQGCQQHGHYLTSVLPASAVLHQQLRQLPLEKGEVALLAAETAGSTTVVIGGSDGQIFLARTLAGNWNEGAERLALDLNRTILFVQQQYGVTVNRGVWLFGPGAEEQCEAIQHHTQMPVQVSPVPYDSYYWGAEAAKLRLSQSPNFISADLQKAPQRHVFAKAMVAIIALVLLGSLSVAIYAGYQAHQEEGNIKMLSSRFDQLQSQQLDLQHRNDKLERDKQISQVVLEGRQPPVPMWFLGYLSEAIPSDLVVTNLDVKHEESGWRMHLAGTSQTSAKPVTPEEFSKAAVVLEDRLASGPFHVKILAGSEAQTKIESQAKAASPSSGIQDWLANLHANSTKPKPVIVNQFVIEGIMR